MSAPLRRRLAELDAQLVEQRRVLHKLQQTRSDVERELYATATFPVLTLPTEITAEIFGRCLLVFAPSCIPKCESSAPIVLTGVCHAWRDIALATPKLWSKLEVRFSGIPDEVASRPGLVEGTIDRWLARAGNCPLSLKFHAVDRNFAPSRWRDMIHRWSHRMQYLYLDIGFYDIGPLALDSAVFPLLQGTTIGCDAEPGLAPVPVFRNAPSFHHLCVLRDEFALGAYVFPWSQLRKFEGTIRDLSLLTLAPNLIELICTFDPDDTPPMRITHRSLKSLTAGPLNNFPIIQYLTLPALQFLDVSKMPYPSSINSFLARSSPPLVSLSMAGSPSSLFYWAPCMPLVAGTLESLEIRHVSSAGMIFMFRTHAPMFDPLPNIRTLNFRDVEGTAITSSMVDSVVSFLRARSDTKLRTFRIVWDPLFHVDTDHLGPLAHIGMDIHVGTAERNYIKRLVPSDPILLPESGRMCMDYSAVVDL
ncbi:hypothetical protein K438DRAFT_1802748 [Mycena galopus ATCC 62051]|nr:hypothetical protein K438DRAFT_1802748 [Mycena galopus ATCC 62051]